MKILLIATIVALALCQTRVVESVPTSWNGWNGNWNNGWNNQWNGWNNWGAWPATTGAVIESPHWWDDSWGRWDNQWNGWNPTWGWNPAWGSRPATWGYGDVNWNGWNRGVATAGARVVAYP